MIPQDTIALVKERTDLAALVGESVKLARRGRTFVGLCPFHQEKTPSFHVNAERGFYHCFGCKESGSAIDFLMKTEGASFREALQRLADKAGVQLVDDQTDQERREANAVRDEREELYKVSQAAAVFFERALRGRAAHPLARYAMAELERRGLPFPEQDDEVGEQRRIGDTLQAFRVGYAPYGWDALATYLRQQGISPVRAEKVGLLVPRQNGSGHYDRFRHRLMFAVTDTMGRVIAFSGRALPDPAPEELSALRIAGPTASPDAQPAKYINSPESPIYKKGEHLFGLYQARQAIRQGGEAVLVEGNFDVVALHARGIGNVVAPLGTAFTEAQARLLKRFAPSVVVLFDGDNAGRKATRAARQPCSQGGLKAKVAVLPRGADPDDFVRKNGPEALLRVLESARGMREYLIDDALDGEAFRKGSLEEQHARLRAVTQILSEENDPNLRAMGKTYADQLSAKLLVQGKPYTNLRELEAAVDEALRAGERTQPARGRQPAPPPIPHDRAFSRSQKEQISLDVLGALFDFPELLDDPTVQEACGQLEGDAVSAYIALRQFVMDHADRGFAAGNHATTGPTQHGHPGSHEADPEGHPPARRLEIGVYAAEFLAQIPPSIQAFAVGRLASPAFETPDVARTVLFENAEKLRRLSLTRQNAAVVDEVQKAAVRGDDDSLMALLREADRAARSKRGLS